MHETKEAVQKRYQEYKAQNLNINMERGWPCKEQLAISMPMLDTVTSQTELDREVDYRGYAGTAGIQPLKEIFAEILEVKPEQIYIGGTMSTSIMYDIVNKAVLFGLDGHTPWKDLDQVKFLCPSPGYEKHFNICKTFGIEMIPVDMDGNGPVMDQVEAMVAADPAIKGIWCVPLYSNPSGEVYSDEVIGRLASMKTAAEDFRIMWDNAYVIHHLTEEEIHIPNILELCAEAGYPDRVFEFASTSKITFPGGGVGVCASSKANIDWLTKKSLLQLKSGDKINQYRHVLFFGDAQGMKDHMKKQAAIIGPKFALVDRVLHEELDELGLAEWIYPKGGYFINVKFKVSASKTWAMCKAAGVSVTPAGSTFPYGKDPEDAYIRLAPTWSSIEDLETAIRVLCLSAKMVYYGLDS